MGVSSSSGGYPNSWLVYFMGNPTKIDDDWGYLYFRKPPYYHIFNGKKSMVFLLIFPSTNPWRSAKNQNFYGEFERKTLEERTARGFPTGEEAVKEVGKHENHPNFTMTGGNIKYHPKRF